MQGPIHRAPKKCRHAPIGVRGGSRERRLRYQNWDLSRLSLYRRLLGYVIFMPPPASRGGALSAPKSRRHPGFWGRGPQNAPQGLHMPLKSGTILKKPLKPSRPGLVYSCLLGLPCLFQPGPVYNALSIQTDCPVYIALSFATLFKIAVFLGGSV